LSNSNERFQNFKYAFIKTTPILAGFLFLGASYGIYMNALGFQPIYAILMSLFIFAGSMEFIGAQLLLQPFNPINTFLLTLMINSRHIFYGLSMLRPFKNIGNKKAYLIYGLCDESFAVIKSTNPSVNIDKGRYMLFVTLLNHFYWVMGATVGSLFSHFIKLDLSGIEFVMTALFLVIFLDEWLREKDNFLSHSNSILGLVIPTICLLIFTKNTFIFFSLLIIIAWLSMKRIINRKIEV